jgi:hypothetical protein
MDEVVGKLENNSFIKLKKEELAAFKTQVNGFIKLLHL